MRVEKTLDMLEENRRMAELLNLALVVLLGLDHFMTNDELDLIEQIKRWKEESENKSKQPVCEWSKTEFDKFWRVYYFKTSCKNLWVYPITKFCPFCGKKIVEVQP
jgi:hypothetical protein